MEIWIKFTVRPRDLKSLSGSSETILWVPSRSKFCHFSAHNQFRSYLHVMYYHVLYPKRCMGLCVHTGNFTNVFTCGPCLLLSEVLQDKEKRQFSHEECTIYQSLKMCESICIFCCSVDWWGFYAQGCDTAHIFTTSIKSTKPFFLLAGINISMLAYQLNFWIKKKNINSI